MLLVFICNCEIILFDADYYESILKHLRLHDGFCLPRLHLKIYDGSTFKRIDKINTTITRIYKPKIMSPRHLHLQYVI